MRLKYSKLCTFIIIIVNFVLAYFTWKLFIVDNLPTSFVSLPLSDQQQQTKPQSRIQSANKHIKKALTIIFRDVFHFDNDLKESIDSILNLIPNVQILVVYDEEPYPPLNFVSNYTATRTNVKFINLGFDIRKSVRTLAPILQIKTKYVLFLPDSVRIGGRSIIQKMLREIEKNIDTNSGNGNLGPNQLTIKRDDEEAAGTAAVASRKIVAVPFASNVKTIGNCYSIQLDFPNWTIEYSVKNGTTNCDMFLQKHAILVDTFYLKNMPNALSPPFPEMFYIQAKVAKMSRVLLPMTLQDGKRLFTAFHNKQHRKEIRKQQFKEMYKKLQIKKVIRKFAGKSIAKIEKYRRQRGGAGGGGGGGGGDGKSDNGAHSIDESRIILHNNSLPLLTTIEYYGCEKNTKSCVGPVYHRKPFYFYQEKNTPPCCMEKLKTVFLHVIEEFENVGIRYWLDNFVLKSAVESNRITPDAFEIDISFNAFDLERSQFLKKAQTKPLADSAGFYWIKATDGHYFRVQFSKQNQIGVNLLPFDMLGDRIVPNGFYGWKAKEFSSEFLHPMSTVVFLNKNIMCPNNVREFLERKNIT